MKPKQFARRFLLAGICLAAALPCRADTGTYRITDYKVKLTPKSDGTVVIQYSQTWAVTGGHIPWITVGTPNSAFEIQSSETKGNVKSVRDGSEGSWSGVRINLDKDYRPGETFQVAFALEQQGLFYAKGDQYGMGFTPGWYDRASIDHLQVEVFFYADINTVTATPKPTEIQGQSMIWEKASLQPGQKFSLDVSFPKSFLPNGVPEIKGGAKAGAYFGIAVFVFIIAILVIIANANYRRYSGGSIFYGGAKGSGGKGRSGGGISSGGGGGFGGRGFSCACACAGCACACACAGGGAAGCDRKLLYRCPLCRDCAHKDQCPLWVREAV